MSTGRCRGQQPPTPPPTPPRRQTVACHFSRHCTGERVRTAADTSPQSTPSRAARPPRAGARADAEGRRGGGRGVGRAASEEAAAVEVGPAAAPSPAAPAGAGATPIQPLPPTTPSSHPGAALRARSACTAATSAASSAPFHRPRAFSPPSLASRHLSRHASGRRPRAPPISAHLGPLVATSSSKRAASSALHGPRWLPGCSMRVPAAYTALTLRPGRAAAISFQAPAASFLWGPVRVAKSQVWSSAGRPRDAATAPTAAFSASFSAADKRPFFTSVRLARARHESSAAAVAGGGASGAEVEGTEGAAAGRRAAALSLLAGLAGDGVDAGAAADVGGGAAPGEGPTLSVPLATPSPPAVRRRLAPPPPGASSSALFAARLLPTQARRPPAERATEPSASTAATAPSAAADRAARGSPGIHALAAFVRRLISWGGGRGGGGWWGVRGRWRRGGAARRPTAPRWLRTLTAPCPRACHGPPP